MFCSLGGLYYYSLLVGEDNIVILVLRQLAGKICMGKVEISVFSSLETLHIQAGERNLGAILSNKYMMSAIAVNRTHTSINS